MYSDYNQISTDREVNWEFKWNVTLSKGKSETTLYATHFTCDRQRQVFSYVADGDRTTYRSDCALLHVDGRNGLPVQGVKKTNKHYSYRERLSLSYSSHELVNTMKRSSARALVRSHQPIPGRKLAGILSSNGSLTFASFLQEPLILRLIDSRLSI